MPRIFLPPTLTQALTSSDVRGEDVAVNPEGVACDPRFDGVADLDPHPLGQLGPEQQLSGQRFSPQRVAESFQGFDPDIAEGGGPPAQAQPQSPPGRQPDGPTVLGRGNKKALMDFHLEP